MVSRTQFSLTEFRYLTNMLPCAPKVYVPDCHVADIEQSSNFGITKFLFEKFSYLWNIHLFKFGISVPGTSTMTVFS